MLKPAGEQVLMAEALRKDNPKGYAYRRKFLLRISLVDTAGLGIMFALVDDEKPPRQNVGGFLISDLFQAQGNANFTRRCIT